MEGKELVSVPYEVWGLSLIAEWENKSTEAVDLSLQEDAEPLLSSSPFGIFLQAAV